MNDQVDVTPAHKPAHRWPIFVISLADAHARRRQIAAQLRILQLDFLFVDAVDGRNGLDQKYEALVDRPLTQVNFGRRLADTEYACALSHMSVYQSIVNQNLPGAVVLEDDAIIGHPFRRFYKTQVYKIADLIQLDHLHGDIWRFRRGLKLAQGLTLVKAARNASLTTGYTVSRRGAEYLLERGLPLKAPADWPCDVTILPTLLVLPRLVDHPPVDQAVSMIEADRSSIILSTPTASRAMRFLDKAYWRRWWFKRRTKRVS